jgi:hypothetical protein
MLWELGHLIDIKPLENLHLKICRGIALSTRDLGTRIVPHHEMLGDLEAALAFKNAEPARIGVIADDMEQHLTPEELELFRDLNYNQKRTFVELCKNAYTDGEFIRVRFTKKEHLTDTFATFYSDTTEPSSNAAHFPELLDWIYTLPFLDVGRVLLFVTRHYMHGDIHYDRRDDWLDGRHHFIWLNPFDQKNFYIYANGEKIRVNSKAAFFDTSYLHGSGVHDRSVYSLRIDGQLDKSFCDSVGIPWKKR